ncbi:putative START domain, Zinc finger, FYVE/PHD-type, Zinc finger, RING/FYVE/PHD-type [Plasmopara halstedii]
MRFDGLRTRSASALPTPKPAVSDVRPQRGHSALPPATTSIPHSMTRTILRHAVPQAASPKVAASKTYSESALPPVDKLFPRSDLEPRMKKHLVRVANETSNALIRDTLGQGSYSSKQWRPAQRSRSSAGSINVLHGQNRGARDVKDATCVRAVSDDVHASIEEFALLFKLDSSREAADHLLLFNADLMQHATLYTLVAPSGEQPRRYVGVKWALVASPSRFFRNRDFCYLECQKEFTDAKGRRGWVRSLHSLKLPCCPSLEKEHGVVRASIYRSGLTAVETDEPGVLSVTYTVELDLKGRMALELLQPGFVAQRVAALATVDKLLQQQRLSSSPLLGDLDIPAKKRMRGSCNLCFREFVTTGGIRDTFAAITNMSTKSKRYVCRKCGEGVCKRCSDDWWLDVPVVGRTKVRICTVCSAEAKHSHISAHTIRAGTCPVQGHDREPTTEVEGVTHPNLLDLPLRARGRSLSLLDRSSDVAAYYAQQEEIKRDLEIRATELNRRVKIWDEMQMYNRDTGLLSDKQQNEILQEQHVREKRRVYEAKHPLRVPSSRMVEQEEEKEEPEAELGPQHGRYRSVSTSEKPELSSLERYPSFMSSELSVSHASDHEEDDFIRLTADTGMRLSSEFCDSNISNYKEHDNSGEIRTTTDVTRWWQHQQATSESSAQSNVHPQNATTPVVNFAALSINDRGAQINIQKPLQKRRAPAAPLTTQEQDLADLYHWKQEILIENRQKHFDIVKHRQQMQEFEEQARYHEEQARRQQQLDFEEMAQYQEEQLRRRGESLDAPVCSPEIPQRVWHQPIQQRHHELDCLQSCHHQLRDDERPSSSQFVTGSSSSDVAKEKHLQNQRQQHLAVASERNEESCPRLNSAPDETSGDDVEHMETSQGEWVPIDEALARRATSDFASIVSSPLHG